MFLEKSYHLPSWVKTGREILDLGITEVPTLWKPFVPKVGVVALAGSSDLGKSYLLLQLMAAVVKGWDYFLGFPLEPVHRRAIYLSTEDDEFSLCPRLINMVKEDGEVTNFENLLTFNDTTDLVNRLDMLLEGWPSDLVVIDTFSDIFEGDMNQANKVRSFLQKFKELAYKHKTAMIFNHHCGKKNDSRPPHKDNLLGSQGFESSMRTVIELRRDFNDPGLRHMCIVKGNYIGEEYKNESHVLQFGYESGFTNTGMRVKFEELVKTSDGQQVVAEEVQKVLSLRELGLSYEKIAAKLTEAGIKISRSKVWNICNDHRSSIHFSIMEKMDGQEKEGSSNLFDESGEEPGEEFSQERA